MKARDALYWRLRMEEFFISPVLTKGEVRKFWII